MTAAAAVLKITSSAGTLRQSAAHPVNAVTDDASGTDWWMILEHAIHNNRSKLDYVTARR